MTNKIISITGTKGKTTVAFLIDQILQKMDKTVLRVDTTGHFINGERKSTLDDSKRIWGLVPTVCPGKFLYELKDLGKDVVSVLECALGSSQACGLGYRRHNVGVWTNVLEDHLGSTPRLQTREDIATAKEFIFSQVAQDGFAIFNADDDLICQKLPLVKNSVLDSTDQLIPCTSGNPAISITEHVQAGGVAFSLSGSEIKLLSSDGEMLIYDAARLPWAFGGHYKPSMLNLMYAIAGLYGVLRKNLPDNLNEIIDDIRLDPYGGRLTVLTAENGAMIIADYAHEKFSLKEVGELAKTLANQRGGKAIGVVRLAYDRTDSMINETGEIVGEVFDTVVVYDKIDGYWRHPKPVENPNFVQEVGRVSTMLAEAAKHKNSDVLQILREDEALDAAVRLAGPNDVVVFIVNDDVRRSVDWAREKFKADFA